MAKVLITPIGTGAFEDRENRIYRKAKYKFQDSEKSYETSFIAAALAEHLKVDKIIFIGTGRSMWEEVYRNFTEESGEKLDYEYWTEIGDKSIKSDKNRTEIDEKSLTKVMLSADNYLKMINPSALGGSFSIIINYGLNDAELWENFSRFMKIAEILNDGDELYLDITHSFRSIPFFMYLIIDFLQILNQKKVKLKGLYYGMFEAKSSVDDFTPIVDLSPLFQISQWIRGIYDFMNYGNGYLISELICDESIENKEIIKKKIDNVSNLLNINYLTDLQKQIRSLDSLLKEKYDIEGPVPYIFPLIKKFCSRFSKIEYASEFQLELGKWFFENKRYGHGYICLTEAILTKLCGTRGQVSCPIFQVTCVRFENVFYDRIFQRWNRFWIAYEITPLVFYVKHTWNAIFKWI